MIKPVVRPLIAATWMAIAGPTWAANLVVTDGDTLLLDGTRFRLDGIDAPEMDQTCLDDSAKVWACGVEARNRLNAHVESRTVRCEDGGGEQHLYNKQPRWGRVR